MITIARRLDWSGHFVVLDVRDNAVEILAKLSSSDAELLHAELTRQLRGADRVSKLERRCERLKRALKKKREVRREKA